MPAPPCRSGFCPHNVGNMLTRNHGLLLPQNATPPRNTPQPMLAFHNRRQPRFTHPPTLSLPLATHGNHRDITLDTCGVKNHSFPSIDVTRKCTRSNQQILHVIPPQRYTPRIHDTRTGTSPPSPQHPIATNVKPIDRHVPQQLLQQITTLDLRHMHQTQTTTTNIQQHDQALLPLRTPPRQIRRPHFPMQTDMQNRGT